MNKLLLSSSIAFLTILSNQVFADEVCKQKGTILSCEAGTVDQIINTGGVRLKGTQVTNQVLVTGSFKAENAKLNEATITGSTEMNLSDVSNNMQVTGSTKSIDSKYHGPFVVTGKFSSVNDTFEQPVSITGQLDSESTTYKDKLSVTAKEIGFVGVNAADVIIHQSSSTNPKQSLYLRENTQITGNIIFEGGNGMVFLSGGSAVAGEIRGAEVYQGG